MSELLDPQSEERRVHSAMVDGAAEEAQPDIADEILGIKRRPFVPSEREVDGGLAEYEFEPMVRPEEPPRPSFTSVIKANVKAADPRKLTDVKSRFPLMLLGLSALFSKWDDQAFGILAPEIRDEFGLDIATVFLIGSILGISTQLFAPVIGYIADRRSRVKLLAIGSVVTNAASMGIGLSPSIGIMSAVRFGGGLGAGIALPSTASLVPDWFPIGVRARIFGFLQSAGGLGLIIGPLVAGGLGSLFGWRVALFSLGAFATVLSIGYFFLREPVRGVNDRLAMGATEEEANQEQRPVTWSEGWRACASIATVRRLWIATPFTVASTGLTLGLINFYYEQEFGASSFTRGFIASLGGVVAVVGVLYGGPIADKILADRPGRIFTIIGTAALVNCVGFVALALSPYLWLSVLIGIVMATPSALVAPAFFTVFTLVIPARLRAFGVQTNAPFSILANLLVILITQIARVAGYSLRTQLLMLIPLGLIGALLIITAAPGVARDIRACLAASMAEQEAIRSKEAGITKMLICRDVDVTYGQTQVLFNLDFDVIEGELVALLGTNGAGKSTLLRAIAGVQPASNGAIFLDGDDITYRPPHQNAAGGIVFMPGGQAVFPSLTVEENLRTAAWMQRDDPEWVAAKLEEVLGYFPVLRERLGQIAGTMSGGEQQQVALGQAFLMKPRILMIDELSLGLAPAIVAQLLDVVRRINAEGTTIILVEQSVNVALTLARRAVFMEKGEIRFDGPTEELLARSDLVRSVFLGGAGQGRGGAISTSGGLRKAVKEFEREQLVAVDDLYVSYGGNEVLRGTTLDAWSGEVVGIIGPNGAGKTTLFDAISGYTTPVSGTVTINGTDCTGMGPDARSRLGVARSFQAARLFPALTVRENVAVALEQRLTSRSSLAAAAWLPQVRKSEKRALRRVEYLVGLLNLEAYADKFVDELSTGSRRMVDLACLMAAEPKLMLLDEPSSGLAQAEVEVLAPVVRRLAKETGCAILVIEHDIPLVSALSDRMIAMELGRVLVQGTPEEVTNHPEVVSAYLGADQAAIGRSGPALAKALSAAGITTNEPEES